MFFLVFITKNANADVILVLDFVNVSNVSRLIETSVSLSLIITSAFELE